MPRQQPFPGVEVPRFCGSCSAPVLTACEHCQAPIPCPDVLRHVDGPNAFCVACGEAFPWATREQLIGSISNQLEFEPGLTDADRLELIEAISVLSVPEDEADHKGQIRAVDRLRTLAPAAWLFAQPILAATLSAEVQAHLPH